MNAQVKSTLKGLASQALQSEQVRSTLKDLANQVSENDEFRIDPRDFFSAKDGAGTAGTNIHQAMSSLAAAAEVLNSSVTKQDNRGRVTNIVSPVVMPKDARSFGWVFMLGLFFFIGLAGTGLWMISPLNILGFIFGPHYYLLLIAIFVYSMFRNNLVEIPDGCQALITRRGAVVEVVGPGKKVFSPFDFFKRVSYIVNTTKEYPYNAPIREAPTQGRVNASVDLFLQFKIEDPGEFIFTLGGAPGFSEKLDNAISEMTRALIYEQRADAIYDLVGESTQGMLENLNGQFLPAVRFVNANITHAEPSDQKYRMDLAAEEIISVAKEAYTHEYELTLRKELDEGELNKELGSLQETLSEIKAEIATYQAQIDTAMEKAINKAEAYARQLMIEAESEARANAALLNAQALDIQALNMTRYPEILEFRYQQEILEQLEVVADKLPQLVNIGPAHENQVDFMATAQQMLGVKQTALFEAGERETLQRKSSEIITRIRDRSKQIAALDTEKSTISVNMDAVV